MTGRKRVTVSCVMGVPHVQGTWRWGNKAFVSVNVSEFSAPSRSSACSLSVTCTKLILFDPNIFDIHLLCRKSLAPLLTTNASGLLQDEPQYSVYLSDLYTKPWCRIGAYLVGMITGYVIHNFNKIRMPKVRVLLQQNFVELGCGNSPRTPSRFGHYQGPQSSGQ